MDSIILNANAKVNLSLDILSRRDDGFHELEMVMCEIPLCDIVKIKKSDYLSVKSDVSFIPTGNGNIAYKAATAFFEYVNLKKGAEIFIEKNIPVSAGLAGGSTDGAAVLKGLNELYNTGLSSDTLEQIGNTVGKDIPFCLRGGICLAKGTGEKLLPLPDLKNCYMVLVKPNNINVSTKEIFNRSDSEKIELHPYTNGIIRCLEKGNNGELARMMYNVLENITSSMYPVISSIKNSFINSGALGAVMSGSGPSVFALFGDRTKALFSYEDMKKQHNQTFFLDMNV